MRLSFFFCWLNVTILRGLRFFNPGGETVLLVGKNKREECGSPGTTELRFLKWRSRDYWFFILLFFLINGKDIQAGLVGFLPFHTPLNQKISNLKQVGRVCLGFMKSPFLK